MNIEKFKNKIPNKIYKELKKRNFTELRPAQHKAISKGLFQDKNLLICTPTASGKTLVAELAFLNAIYHDNGKAVYVVPLKALASEKYKTFKKDYPDLKIGLSSGDIDSDDSYLRNSDLIITTSEKFDSLIRHRAPWINEVKVLVIDEIHLMNDPGRGPTLEIVITLMRKLIKKLQIVGLSATVGNPEEMADWLDAKLILDTWRPVKLKKGVYLEGEVEFN